MAVLFTGAPSLRFNFLPRNSAAVAVLMLGGIRINAESKVKNLRNMRKCIVS